jgi:hypothetical protein
MAGMGCGSHVSAVFNPLGLSRLRRAWQRLYRPVPFVAIDAEIMNPRFPVTGST